MSSLVLTIISGILPVSWGALFGVLWLERQTYRFS